ncbi:hypothetical protein NX059_011978 [Plenodomus lindquistii]|nr:hypothetical protein NX059_011978 [Plenodomus lindquistii]
MSRQPGQPAQSTAGADRSGPASAPDTRDTLMFLSRHALEDRNVSMTDECPICLDNYSDDECVRIVGIPGCNHHIGRACLRDLLNRNPNQEKRCPICRALWIAPRPTAPQYAAPQPAAPRPVAPRPTAPQTTVPRPTAPRPTDSRPAAPQPTAPAATAGPMGQVDIQGILNNAFDGLGNMPGLSGNNSMSGANGATPSPGSAPQMTGLGDIQGILSRALGPLSGLSALGNLQGANGGAPGADPNNPTGGVDVQAIVNKALSGFGELGKLGGLASMGSIPGMNGSPGMNDMADTNGTPGTNSVPGTSGMPGMNGAALPTPQPRTASHPARPTSRRAGHAQEQLSMRQQIDAARNRSNRNAAATSAVRENYAAEARNFNNFNRDLEDVRERARDTGFAGRRGRVRQNDNAQHVRPDHNASRDTGPTNRYLDSLRNPNGGYGPNTGAPQQANDFRAVQAETERLRILFGNPHPNDNDPAAGAQQPRFTAPPTRRPPMQAPTPRAQLPLPNMDSIRFSSSTPPPPYSVSYIPVHQNVNPGQPQFNAHEAALRARQLALARREAEMSLRDTNSMRREGQMGNGSQLPTGAAERLSEQQREVLESVRRGAQF